MVDVLSFLVQNFNPINLDIKLDMEKERDMIKFIWNECIPDEFVRFTYKDKYYEEISQPNFDLSKSKQHCKRILGWRFKSNKSFKV